jgi:hypothetical protein
VDSLNIDYETDFRKVNNKRSVKFLGNNKLPTEGSIKGVKKKKSYLPKVG